MNVYITELTIHICNMIRLYRYILLLAFCLFGFEGNDLLAKDHTLFSNGESGYSIIVSSDASESEKYAASELQTLLYKIGNVTIPIKNCGKGSKERRIIVGYNRDSKSLFPDIIEPTHDDDGFTYKNNGGDIIIIGGCDRGTMYGVFAFLENEMGCRWYAEDYTFIPTKKEYSFSALNHAESPAFTRRSVLFTECRDMSFRIHCRLNERIITSPSKPQAQIGGAYSFLSPHTMQYLLPIEKYYDKHPEYFALVKGKRDKETYQPCFSNPDVLRICTNELRSIMRLHPQIDIFEISGLDNWRECECESCSKEKKRRGSYSDLLLSFVNSVSDRLKDEFPNKRIEYLAYQNSRSLPHSVKPHKNVVVRFCSSGICHTHGLSSCETDKSKQLYEDLIGWKKLTKELYIWDYASNFAWYNIPYPNLYALQDNLQLYNYLGVKGVFLEGNHYSKKGEFYALKIYVLTKLLWNPNQDIDALVDDFIYHYYGSSAREIRQYFNLIYTAVKDNTHLLILERYDNNYYDEDLIRKSEKIFKIAKKKADSEVVLRRIEVEELSSRVVYCMRNPLVAEKDGTKTWVQNISEREEMAIVREREKSEYDSKMKGSYNASQNFFEYIISTLIHFFTSGWNK